MKILFFSYDLGPANNLKLVARESLIREHQVIECYTGKISDVPEETFNIVVTGLSSFKNEGELDVGGKVSAKGGKWYVLADTFRAWGRKAAEGKVSRATAIVASASEYKEAMAFGYEDAVYLGGPPKWEIYWTISAVQLERKEGEKIVLVSGIKDENITNELLAQTRRAMNGSNWKLIFRPHSKEAVTFEGSAVRKELLATVNTMNVAAYSQEELAASVDLSICTSGATVSIISAILRKPSVYFENPIVRKRIEDQTGIPTWYPAETGAAALATPENFQFVIEHIMEGKGRKEQKKIQEELFPSEGREVNITKKILDFIESR